VKRILLNLLTRLSLLLIVAICAEEALRFPDDDFSFYRASNGSMISVDSFEDTPHANAITVRRIGPMPSDIPFQFRHCSLECGNEAPSVGVGKSVEIWLDRNNQPVVRDDANGRAVPMTVSIVAQIPLYPELYLLLAAFIPAVRCVVKYRSWRTHQRRRESGHCSNCGYDCRATPDRCPECGRVPGRLRSVP